MNDEADTPWMAIGSGTIAVALVLAACRPDSTLVCPAIGWSNAITVELADEWPAVEDGSLVVTCSSGCPRSVGDPATGLFAKSVPVTGRAAVIHVDMTQPGSVVLTVLDGDTEVAHVDADLDWRRVGGSEECGGPSGATVVIPGP